MTPNRQVTVFGAYGHTGKFVIAELVRRGWRPVLSGRDPAKLIAMREIYPQFEACPAHVDDPLALMRALSGSGAVINCAGPFIDTAQPIIEAAIRSGIHYADVTAEQSAVLDVFERFDDAAVVIIPAMAFYGGLSDLLATAAMGEWERADEIDVAVALDSWKPTRGTRLTGERNHGPRYLFSNGKLAKTDPPPGRVWGFPAPFGDQDVVTLPLAETITISRHLRTLEIRPFLNVAPLTELRNPETPGPVPADESGRSSQNFVVDVVVRKGNQERRIVASGRDIYAITAPIVVEAVERILEGRVIHGGVVTAGQAFDAPDFLSSLGPSGLTVNWM